MESGWIINFKNGYRVILSESAYKKYQAETPKEDVQSEEHWFSLDKAIMNNPDLDLIADPELENSVKRLEEKWENEKLGIRLRYI